MGGKHVEGKGSLVSCVCGDSFRASSPTISSRLPGGLVLPSQPRAVGQGHLHTGECGLLSGREEGQTALPMSVC